jgi:hypothetical protein
MSALSTTYGFAPETAEFVAEAFERIQIEPEAVTARHAISARRSLNFMLASWVADGYKGPLITTQSITLTQGQIQVPLALPAVDVFHAYLTRSGYDTEIYPISRSDYEAIPNKTQQGRPTMYFVNRSTTLNNVAGPNVFLWQASQNATDIVNFSCLNRFMDVGASNNALQAPYVWYEALASGLSAHLARKWRPDLFTVRALEAGETYKAAMSSVREKSSTKFRARFRL